ncbi:MAG TPA: hypothetical protein VGO60_12115, partial [Iamia sp.]|nr:hypothetical protein [Iamia sp.]
GPALASRWCGEPRPLLPFVVDLSFTGYHDDRTVVAAWIAPAPPMVDVSAVGPDEDGEAAS